ncbi:MAG: PD-(D/E)XK nuclease family protein [Micrococcales bacterium]|nr:PD-(D/E)XK nuclease family protein [Micrococcales bacterium]
MTEGITNGGMPYTLSNSEIQVFKDCRRKWWLNYYRRLMPKKKDYTGALALGSRIHEALDQYYSSDGVIDLLDAHTALVNKDMDTLVAEFRDTSALEAEAELGRIMLEGYLQWMDEEGIDSNLDKISNEEIISMPLFNGEVILQGKLDMRVRRKNDGVRMFRDFKTVGGSFSDFASQAQMNEQILTYMLLEHAQNTDPSERSEGGIFTLLKKVKRTANARPPFYEQIEVRHNVFTMRAFWQRIHGAISDLIGVKKALDEGADPNFVAYPRPTKDCKWKCQFYTICPLIDDGSAAEAAISEMYEVSDPYGYYGKDEEKKGSE